MQKPSKVAKVELEGAGWRGLQLRCVGKGLGSRCLEANAGELGKFLRRASAGDAINPCMVGIKN